MSANFQQQIVALIAAYGQTITFTSGGSTYTRRALAVPMDNATINTYFDGNEAVGLVRPALMVFTDGTSLTQPHINDIFSYPDANSAGRGGSPFTVLKTQVFRVAGVPLLVLSLCD